MKVAIKHKSYGFSITELLVVIVVIGILAAISVVAYQGITSKAKIDSIASDLIDAKKQLNLYKLDNHTYPTSLDQNTNCPIPSGTDTALCLKLSGDNSVFNYSGDSTNFQLIIQNGSIQYQISEDSSPVVYP